MDSVKILLVTNDFPPRKGGIQKYLLGLVSQLPPEKVAVLAPWDEGASRFDRTVPYAVSRFPSPLLLPTPSLVREVVALVESGRPDVVCYGHGLQAALVGPAVRERTGVPYVIFTHGAEAGLAGFPFLRQVLRRAARGASLVFAVSGFAARLVARAVPRGVPVRVLPAGVDEKRFNPHLDAGVLRRRLGLEGETVVCVGRLVRRKGQDMLVKAMARLAPSFPRLRLVLVGGGPSRPRLERLAARLGVRERVLFAGVVREDELPLYYRAGDVFAMPARTRLLGLDVEGLGLVYLEAAASGLPVVAGRSGGAPEAVEDGTTGLLVDGGNLDELTSALEFLLEDPATARKMGEAGRKLVETKFSWAKVGEEFKAALARVVRGGEGTWAGG